MDRIKLRKVKMSDAADLFRWRNDPETRKVNFQSAPVKYKGHLKWLASSLTSRDRLLFMAEDSNGEVIGHVRLDRLGKGIGEFGVLVVPEKRGRGYGPVLIKKALSMRRFPIYLARVKQDNPVSLKTFIRAGFVHVFDYESRGNGRISLLIYKGKL
ncbi:MAG: GNAT family N-acetyltransferase [Candidatus Margulisbacteria bacterium]|nr:GNAT family N-acetyltransferase [Candidatus Margulisiibacteriota bacterium]MBU1617118.1 GNAT family N-acetyltransferase [Candidatus Margulisiibacteriota bacterium]